MDEQLRQQIEALVPGGDWYGAGHWRKTPLYLHHPRAVERAMDALAKLATPEWFRAEAAKFFTIEDGGRLSNHPIILAALSPDYISFWPVFCFGDDLATLENRLPGTNPIRWRERPLGERLLRGDQYRGAAGELAAAAMLRRAGIRFDWFPDEGGEFAIEGDTIEFVEVKRPLIDSERTITEMRRLHRIREELHATVPGHVIEYSLKADLADRLTDRKRERVWERILQEFRVAAQEIVQSGRLPTRRDLAVGTLWVAKKPEELAALRAGCMGLAIDETHDAHRVVRGPIKAAIDQLPLHRRALIYIEWSGMGSEFIPAVERRLGGLEGDVPQVVGVLVRGSELRLREIVPRSWAYLIENPRMQGVAQSSRVVDALSVDHHAHLRMIPDRPRDRGCLATAVTSAHTAGDP